VKTLGQGVTATTIKIGIALVDFKCIEPYIQTTRVDEYKVYQAFIDDINAHGGVAGRKIVPDYKTFCPIVPAPALALCTTFTEDDHVFAVLGDFVDLTGQAQPCIAKQHKTVLISFQLTGENIASAPGGMMLTFNATQERRVAITLELLKREGTLKGKTVAILGEATTKKLVSSVLEPGLKAMGAHLGSTAILTISGADTTAAASQLQSFVERWKTEGVDTVYLSGLQVSAQQFVPALVKAMPGVQLIADNQSVSTYGQNLQTAGVRPNPYEGIITTAGLSAKDYDKTDNWKTCAAVYEKAFHKTAPNQESVIPGPRGHTLDVSGSITDACTELTMFHDIGQRVGKYLNDNNWINTVNNYGKIRVMVVKYGSIHEGKYDADDTAALVAFDSSIGPQGDWRYLTPVQDVSGDG
jgi:ABC-type branched-subunit amino acid transport system substrate-binding protein